MKIHDSIEAIFSAFYWGPVRTVLGLGGIISVFAACAATGKLFTGSSFDVMLVFATIPFMFFAWTAFGLFALLGIVAGVAMWGSLYAFIVLDSPKEWFFAMLTGALVYFCPLAKNGRWYFLIIGYVVVTLLYWGIPMIVTRKNSGLVSNDSHVI